MDLLQALQAEDMAAVCTAVKANPAAAKTARMFGTAAGRALLPAVRLLHKNGADLNAAMFGLLLEREADATGALGHAVWGKQYDLAERALAHGAQVDRATANGKPLLNDLIRWGQMPQTIADAGGWTAAHQAVSRGNARLLRAVIDSGADLDRRDQAGRTPLDVARVGKREKLLAMMA
jgi:hypothetical protein